ncbi:uncharacterized protein LOC132259509 [Phlebotomus argentipes]|uniref:uncharacterized protein LOC132259509 n=1 Tax=Phlebotomus argentipes TaxID=94469 RepID=UPI0028932145|nr:uncharacterized protein LOC132259509 [Phlebotomus argentipes]
MSRAAKFIVLFLVSVTICSVFCRPAAEESENDEKSDLETSELFLWPKLFFWPKVAVVKAAPVVQYDYVPVNYTYYRPVWTPYTVTVQKPVATVAVASPPVVAEPAVVAAKGVSVNVGVGK